MGGIVGFWSEGARVKELSGERDRELGEEDREKVDKDREELEEKSERNNMRRRTKKQH